jgi:hypothetical protein
MEIVRAILMRFLQILSNSIQFDNVSLEGYHQYRIVILWQFTFSHIAHSAIGSVSHAIAIGFAYWAINLAFITYDSLPTNTLDDK